jgi:hypothetical protein
VALSIEDPIVKVDNIGVCKREEQVLEYFSEVIAGERKTAY